ncbi:MAG: Sodium/pantothenate symporter [Chlamydiae bacterium]|nr:Sodium/pantothenate symporter [Chlamydiota bacterium]
MISSSVDIGFFVAFMALLIGSGIYRARRVQSERGYLLADRNTGLFSLTATLVMTEFNTATLISFASMGYLVGLRALLLPLIFLVGLLFYAAVVAKKWKSYNGLSVAGFFTERYGRDIGLFASITLLLAMAGFSATYVKSLSLLFAPLIPGVSPWLVSGVLVALVLLMIWRGGLVSIIRTDLVSGVIILAFFPILAFFAGRGEAPPVIDSNLAAQMLPSRFVISLIVLTMFTYILAPWYGQKIFAARSEKVAYRAVGLSALIVFALYGCVVFSASAMRGVDLTNPEMALGEVILRVLPTGLRGLGVGILFAASATTLTGVWSAMCTLVIGDFMKEGASARRSRGLTVCFALCSFLLANLFVDRVFDKLILANIPIAALSFALLAGFYWKGATRMGALVSIGVGWASGLFAYFYFGEVGGYTWYWAIFGIPIIFITGIVSSLLFKRKVAIDF